MSNLVLIESVEDFVGLCLLLLLPLALALAGAALRPPGSHASSANSLFSVNEAPPTETFTMDRTGGSLGN